LNKSLLHTDVQDFINKNLNNDLNSLVLKGSPFGEVGIRELAVQIQSKSKCLDKLPLWFRTEGIYFPKAINIEQSSSEKTAAYKAQFTSGQCLVDITGGAGADRENLMSIGTIRTLASCLSELLTLFARLGPASKSANLCDLLDCPQRPVHREAIVNAIEVLKRTKGTFKSKALAELRTGLEDLLGGCGHCNAEGERVPPAHIRSTRGQPTAP